MLFYSVPNNNLEFGVMVRSATTRQSPGIARDYFAHYQSLAMTNYRNYLVDSNFTLICLTS